MGPMKKGQDVYIFYRMSKKVTHGRAYMAVLDPRHGAYRPRVGMSEGWVPAKIAQDFNGAKGQSVHVEYQWPHFFTVRGNLVDSKDEDQMRDVYNTVDVRLASDFPALGKVPRGLSPPAYQPELSIISFRWGGLNECVAPSQWGDTGSPVSTVFFDSFIDRVVLPQLGREYEVWTVYIEDKQDLQKLADMAHLIFGPNHPARRAKRTVGMYFLYPTGFEEGCIPNMETGEDHGAGMVDQKSIFKLMHAMERAAIVTKFPHCSFLYELLTSKKWTYMLTLASHLNVPATVAVPRGLIELDVASATEKALFALDSVRKQQAALKGLPAPAESVKKGAAKLGHSWEALDVKFWKGKDGDASLQDALFQLSQNIEINGELTGQPHDNESIMVQEFIEHDLELRVYTVDGKPEILIYTKFCRIKENNEFGDFQQTSSREEAAKMWVHNDVPALQAGEDQCFTIAQHWLTWIMAQCCEMPPAIRFDFFIKRTGPGTAQVYTLEICELGFSMLGDSCLPEKVFNALLKSCLADKPRG